MNKKIIIGLAILALLMPLVTLADTNDVFGVNAVANELAGTIGTTRTPQEVAARIINIALGFLGLVAVVIVLYGGFMWMTAGGNEERITKAKQILTAGIIGLVIIIMAWGLTTFVLTQLRQAVNT